MGRVDPIGAGERLQESYWNIKKSRNEKVRGEKTALKRAGRNKHVPWEGI